MSFPLLILGTMLIGLGSSTEHMAGLFIAMVGGGMVGFAYSMATDKK